MDVLNVVLNLNRGNIIFVIFILELKCFFLKFLYCILIKVWNKKLFIVFVFFELNEELFFKKL